MTYLASVEPSNGAVVYNTRPSPTVYTYVDDSDISGLIEVVVTKDTRSVSGSQQVFYGFGGSAFTSATSIWLPEDLEPGIWTIVAYSKIESAGGPWVDVPGSPSAPQTFTVSSKGATTQRSPAADSKISWSGTFHSLNLTWTYSSTSDEDIQTSYQVQVRREDNQNSVNDTGKLSSNVAVNVITGTTVGLPPEAKDIWLEWRVRSWNSQDVAQEWTGWRRVLIGTPPSLVITSPTADQVVSNGTVSVTLTPTAAGVRHIDRIEASLWKGTTKLWQTIRTGVWASTSSVTVADANFVVPQSTEPYQYRVTVRDSAGITSSQVVRNFTVAYTQPNPPAIPPTVSIDKYEDSGYVSFRWGGEMLDADFYSWIVERSVAPLDPNTGAIIGGNSAPGLSVWGEIGRVYNKAISYEYRDYLAPSNHYVQYRVRQVAIRFGTELPSIYTSNPIGMNAISRSYWLATGINKGTMRPVKNYVWNPVPASLTGWSTNATISTMTLVTTPNRVRIVFNGTAGVSQLAPVSTEMPVTLGQVAYFSMKYQGPGGRTVVVHHRDSADSIINQTVVTLPNSPGAETTVSFPIEVTSPVVTHLFLAQICYAGPNPTNGETHNFREVMFTDAPEGTAFFSGGTSGAVWDGTTSQSTSSTFVADSTYPDQDVLALRLYNVTADSFTKEVVSNEYNLLGRGRYSEKGDTLGVKGSLTAQLRDGQGNTAREKRLSLEDYREAHATTSLRTPFGDVYSVAIGDLGITRIAGTGLSEFTDVTIPYSEVIS